MRIVFAMILALSATQTFADEIWSEREICRAATKTYFWLKELPSDAPDEGVYMGFMSERQNYYTCRVDGDVADFLWVNKSFEKMRSQSTKFEINGSTLTVETDMKTENFTPS